MTAAKISLADKLAQFTDHWQPRIVADYNGNEVRLAKISGAFIWHAHEDTDELFLVVDGAMTMHFRDRSVAMGPGDLIVVPRGVEHKPEATGECHILMLDRSGTLNTGNVDSDRAVPDPERI